MVVQSIYFRTLTFIVLQNESFMCCMFAVSGFDDVLVIDTQHPLHFVSGAEHQSYINWCMLLMALVFGVAFL